MIRAVGGATLSKILSALSRHHNSTDSRKQADRNEREENIPPPSRDSRRAAARPRAMCEWLGGKALRSALKPSRNAEY